MKPGPLKPGPPEFRHVLAHWSTGVAVVATLTRSGGPCGLTATAVAAVSLSPLLVLACIERGADSHDALRAAGVFSINILDRDGEAIARRFAGSDGSAKFRDVAHHVEASGAPVLDEALAWVDCRVHAAYDGGDHTIFVGEVFAAGAREGEPLVYHRGRYGRLAE
ncbi:MAG TPA: flavin reductase family protein [Longimicrobiales bacterium]|nr:flavin reductase family protein [Longimicrobiales bacterium]